MKYPINTVPFHQSDSSISKSSTPLRLLYACTISCLLGIALMALTSHYLLILVFLGILISMGIMTWLFRAGKVCITAASLTPMLLLCFVYTPLSWFTFDGLLGCTPYLSILFITVITLTYYGKVQAVVLTLYSAQLLGLTAHWLATQPDQFDLDPILNILVAYVLTVSTTVGIIEGVKHKNREINKHILDLSLHDDLTGLLNRRAVDQIFEGLEHAYLQDGADYTIVILDIDKFKAINDLAGHHLGDSVLKSVAVSLQNGIRLEDYAVRLGGDEFLIVLSHVERETACQVCTRLDGDLQDIQGYAFPVTVSLGFASRSEAACLQSIMELADKRMYEAKQKKRSREISLKKS